MVCQRSDNLVILARHILIAGLLSLAACAQVAGSGHLWQRAGNTVNSGRYPLPLPPRPAGQPDSGQSAALAGSEATHAG